MSDRPATCEAYERGDQYFCDKCQMTWDLDDKDPPGCSPSPDYPRHAGSKLHPWQEEVMDLMMNKHEQLVLNTKRKPSNSEDEIQKIHEILGADDE